MRRLMLALILLGVSLPLWGRGKIQGWCENGNVGVSIPGTQGSGVQKFQQSYSSCIATVYNSGTLVLATIYSDMSATPKANPFTSASSGQWFFYADSGRYDVKFSGAGIPSPFTLGDLAPQEATTTLDCSVFPGANAGAKMSACIAALPSAGFADSRLISGAQNNTATVSVPANVALLLSCNLTLTTTVKAFSITGDGGKVIGCGGGTQDITAVAQAGTIIRAGVGFPAGSDFISASNVQSIEIGGLILDFANTSSTTGRDGIYLSGVSHAYVHDDWIFNPGRNCVTVDTVANHSYDLDFSRNVCVAANTDGWLMTTAGGTADIDRVSFRHVQSRGYNPGDNVTRFSTNGFHLNIPAGSVITQGISNVYCDDCFTTGTVDGGSGFRIDQLGTAQFAHLFVRGLFEDPFQANAGTAFLVNSSAADRIYDLDINFVAAGYTTGHNLSTSNAQQWSLVQGSTVGAVNSVARRMDGLQFGDRSVPAGASLNTLKFYSSAGGNYSLGTGADGIVRYRRDDTNTDIFHLNGPLGQLNPAADNTFALGSTGLRWSAGRFVNLTLGGGLQASTGAQHARFASCTTGAPLGSTCTTTFNWVAPFPDSNYTVTCSVSDASAGVPYLLEISHNNAQVAAVIANFTASAAAGTIHCIAFHD